MADSPFRERRLSPEEVQRVLKRAAELTSTDAAGGGEPLTEAELERRLAELGIPEDIARRAMEPVTATPTPAADGALRVERELVVEGRVDPARFDEIADAIAGVMKSEGRTSAVGNKLTWTPGGMLMEPAITVQVKDGETHIRYVETLANRGQVLLGFGTLSSLGALAAGGLGGALAQAAAGQGSPLVIATGVLLGTGAGLASFLGLRRMLTRRTATRTALAEQVMAHVGARVRACIAPAKTRVAVSDDSEQAEAEAEAEETEQRRREA